MAKARDSRAKGSAKTEIPIETVPLPSASYKTRTEDAWIRIGLAREVVDREPRIGHMMRKIGGKDRALEVLRGSPELEARKFCESVDLHGKVAWSVLPMEAFGLAVGIRSRRLLELITGAIFEQSHQEALLVAAATHPDVVAATVEAAMRLDGTADRKMLHMHNKFLPMPKSTTVFGNLSVDQRKQEVNVTLSSAEDRTRKLSDRFNEKFLGEKGLNLLPPAPDLPDESDELEN